MSVTVDAAANIQASAPAPTITRKFSVSSPNIALGLPQPTIRVRGDYFADAIPITGSGTTSFNLAMYSVETGEPGPAPAVSGVAVQETCWLLFTANGPSDLDVDTGLTAIDTVIEVYQGPSIDALNVIDANDDSTQAGDGAGSSRINGLPIGGGNSYYVRVRPKPSVTGTPQVTFRWASSARTFDLQAQLYSDTLDRAPGILKVSVLNGDPATTVDFYILPDTTTPVASVLLDSLGTVHNTAVPVSSRAAGSYTLRVLDSGTRQVDLPFTVTNDPEPTGSTLPGDVNPSITGGTGIQKWQLIDPNGLGTYTFPVNPAQMSSPWPKKGYSFDHTTSVDGQVITWEGTPQATQWSFKGYITSQQMYNDLTQWAGVARRIYLVDHFARKWIVSLEKFDAVPVRDVNNAWTHSYTMSAIIYAGPVS